MSPTPRRPAARHLFPRLKGGRSRLEPAEVAAHQRRRLRAAMIAVVAEEGYPATTVDKVSALAGVSKRHFYAHFDSKEDCFLATFEEILERLGSQAEEAAAAQQGVYDQLVASSEVVAELVASDRDAIALLLVDSLTLGPTANEPRLRSQERFEQMLAAGFSMEGVELPERTVRAIVIGLRRVLYRAIRDHSEQQLAAGAPALAAWASGYRREVAPAPAPAVEPVPPTAEESPGWEEPPNSPESRLALSQRDRLLRAAAQVAVEGGYEKLTIPLISARAGTSNQAFYANFESKDEALLAAFDALADRVVEAAATAYSSAPTWPANAEAGLAALIHHVASNRLFAELAFVQLPAAGRPGLERIDRVMDRLGEVFKSSAPPLRSHGSKLVVDAIVGGAWGSIRMEVLGGHWADLADLQAWIVQFVVTGLASLVTPASD